MVNGYTTPLLVQAEARISGLSSSTTPSLDQVFNWINEESRGVEVRLGEVFSSTVVSSTFIDYDGSEVIRLPHFPIISITELLYNVNGAGMAPSWVSFTEGYDKNYLLYSDEGEVELVSGNNRTVKYTPLPGKKKFCISYVHGYDKTPLEIQKLVTMLVAKRVISSLSASQANTEGGSVQIGTIRITDPTVFSINFTKYLSSEIELLFQTLGRSVKTYRLNRVYD